MPITIYRSGYISGESINGVTNLNDALLMLIKGCIQLGIAPDLEENITILPVDFVSNAIANISLQYPGRSAIYHLDHPVGITWLKLVEWLNNYGYQIKIVDLKEWQEMLVTLSQDNAIYPFLPLYLNLKSKQASPKAVVANTTKILDELSLNYPPISDELLRIYFNYLYEVQFLPQTNKQQQPEKL